MSVSGQYTNAIVSYDNQAIIPSGQAQSEGIDCGGLTLCGLIMPSAWDAAFIRLQFSLDKGNTWIDHKNPADDSYYVYQVSAGNGYQIPVVDTNLIQYFRILSVNTTSTGTLQNQTAQRTITIALRPT